MSDQKELNSKKPITISDLSKALNDKNFCRGNITTDTKPDANPPSQLFNFQTTLPPPPVPVKRNPTTDANPKHAFPDQNISLQPAPPDRPMTFGFAPPTQQFVFGTVHPQKHFPLQSAPPDKPISIFGTNPPEHFSFETVPPPVKSQNFFNLGYDKPPGPTRYKTASEKFVHRKRPAQESPPLSPGNPRRRDSIRNYIYFKTIDGVSLVIWLFSRVFKHKIYLFLLLPFMAYLFKGTIVTEIISNSINTILLNINFLFLRTVDMLPDLFTYSEDMSLEDIPEEISCTEKFLIVMQFVWLTVFNLLAHVSNKAYTSLSRVTAVSKTGALLESSVQFLSAKILPKKDEIKSIASEVVEEKLTNILKKIEAAHLKYESFDDLLSNSSDRFDEWLQHKLANYEVKSFDDLKSKLNRLYRQNETDLEENKDIKRTVERTVKKYIRYLGSNSVGRNDSLPDEECSSSLIQKLVKEALLVYDADKTGLVDYASENMGGSIVSTRCSESYVENGNQFNFLGINLWSGAYNSPRKAIQPSMQPGQCWAFKGSKGFLVIKLAYTIYPIGFSMEHIPVSLSPSGSIDSAPHNFSVWGLQSENDKNGKILGTYNYTLKGLPLQYFPVQTKYDEAFSLVELKIHSNQGNKEYTCLYRFRVHGNRENRKQS